MEKRRPPYSRGEDTWLLYSEATTEGAPNAHKGERSSFDRTFAPRDSCVPSRANGPKFTRPAETEPRLYRCAEHIHARRKCVLFHSLRQSAVSFSFFFSFSLFFFSLFFYLDSANNAVRSIIKRNFRTRRWHDFSCESRVEGSHERVERRDPRRSMRVFGLDINRPRAAGGKPLALRRRKPVQLIFANPAGHPPTRNR